jgi:hypothetical protein
LYILLDLLLGRPPCIRTRSFLHPRDASLIFYGAAGHHDLVTCDHPSCSMTGGARLSIVGCMERTFSLSGK